MSRAIGPDLPSCPELAPSRRVCRRWRSSRVRALFGPALGRSQPAGGHLARQLSGHRCTASGAIRRVRSLIVTQITRKSATKGPKTRRAKSGIGLPSRGNLPRPSCRRWVRRPGPTQRPLVNRVRVGRQQLSAGEAVCRSQPGRRTERRARSGRPGTKGEPCS
jgi:hypothetical protein